MLAFLLLVGFNLSGGYLKSEKNTLTTQNLLCIEKILFRESPKEEVTGPTEGSLEAVA